jgi:tetratricopeptide (TPR) repeat protein
VIGKSYFKPALSLFVIILSQIANFAQSLDLQDDTKYKATYLPYYENYNFGWYYFEKADYPKAYYYFKRSISINPKPTFVIVYKLVQTCSKLNKYNEAKEWLMYLKNNFGSTNEFLKANNIITVSNKIYFEEILHKNGDFYCHLGEKEKFDDLCKIKAFYDQFSLYIKNKNIENERNGFHNNFFEAQFNHDTLGLQSFFIHILSKYRFPSEYDLGADIHGKFISLLRVYLKLDLYNKKILDSALLEFKISPIDYAFIVNSKINLGFGSVHNIGLFSTKPNVNYFVNLKVKNNVVVIDSEIKNVEEIDSDRKLIGLLPLWMDAEIRGFNLPENYKLWLHKK